MGFYGTVHVINQLLVCHLMFGSGCRTFEQDCTLYIPLVVFNGNNLLLGTSISPQLGVHVYCMIIIYMYRYTVCIHDIMNWHLQTNYRLFSNTLTGSVTNT